MARPPTGIELFGGGLRVLGRAGPTGGRAPGVGMGRRAGRGPGPQLAGGPEAIHPAAPGASSVDSHGPGPSRPGLEIRETALLRAQNWSKNGRLRRGRRPERHSQQLPD